MYRTTRLAAVLSSLALLLALFAPAARAADPAFLFDQTTLFQVCDYGGCFDAVYAQPNNETAEDVVFSGTRRITSLSYAYGTGVSITSVNATIRFYAVDPATGGPGKVIAQLTDPNLPLGSPFVRTINLTSAQQFDWTATPGIYGDSSAQGGFVSVQLYRGDGEPFASGQAGIQLANATTNTLPNFWDVTLKQRTAIENNPGIYFKLGDQNTPPAAELTSLTIAPSRIKYGRTATGTVKLSAPAPKGGAKIDLRSSNTLFAQVPYEGVTVPEGQTSATFKISTFRPDQRAVDVVITATYQGPSKTATITVTR